MKAEMKYPGYRDTLAWNYGTEYVGLSSNPLFRGNKRLELDLYMVNQTFPIIPGREPYLINGYDLANDYLIVIFRGQYFYFNTENTGANDFRVSILPQLVFHLYK